MYLRNKKNNIFLGDFDVPYWHTYYHLINNEETGKADGYGFKLINEIDPYIDSVIINIEDLIHDLEVLSSLSKDNEKNIKNLIFEIKEQTKNGDLLEIIGD